MSEKEGQPGRPADENLDGSHVVRDEAGDRLPYQYLPRESRSVRVDRQGLGILVEASELLLVGTSDEIQRPRYIGLAPVELITYSDLLKFLVTLHNLTSLEKGSRRLPPAASAGRLLLTATPVTPKPPYPSLSRGMLAYTEALRDRVLASRANELPGSKGKLPDGVVAGDLFNDPTQYVPASGIRLDPEVPFRSIDELAAQDAPTTNMQPIEKPSHPYQTSDKLSGNPPVEFFRPVELPPKT